MAEFLFELILKAVTLVVRTLVELVCVQTARVVLPVVSFGALTAHQRFAHPPAYGERRPIVVGPLAATLFGVAFWTIAIIALITFVR